MSNNEKGGASLIIVLWLVTMGLLIAGVKYYGKKFGILDYIIFGIILLFVLGALLDSGASAGGV